MNKKTLMYIGIGLAVGAVIFTVIKNRGAGAGPVAGGYKAPVKKLTPAHVGKGELVSAKTWQKVSDKDPAAKYASAQTLAGGLIQFTSPIAGWFTRNVLQDSSGRLYAEVKANV